MLKLNSPEWIAIVTGCIGAIISGASIPLYSIVFGDIVGVLSDSDNDVIRTEGNKFSLYFFIIGVVTGFASLFQVYFIIIFDYFRIFMYNLYLVVYAGNSGREINNEGTIFALC